MAGGERMIEQCKNPEQTALVGLCGYAGLRISEARLIVTENFNTHDMTLTVRGKGDRTRIIPLSNRAWCSLSSAFVHAMGRSDTRLIRYSDRAARKIITNLSIRARLVRPVASHDLRATFGTTAFYTTKDLRVVQELLGHANSTQTEVYTGVSMDRMRDAVEF